MRFVMLTTHGLLYVVLLTVAVHGVVSEYSPSSTMTVSPSLQRLTAAWMVSLASSHDVPPLESLPDFDT